MSRRRALVTGHDGYIGSAMLPFLLADGWDVVGLDAFLFEGCSLVPDLATVPAMRKDVRDLVREDLTGFDAVVHLAALSNDPIGNLNAAWTRQVNLEATVRLAELAREAGVRRFLFSSSCIMYGVSQEATASETSPLNPQTEYARSKVLAEEALHQFARDDFSPVALRNGTVYGLAPRMRFDTVVNDLVGAALTSGVVTVVSDGAPWRPVVHVEDVARAFAHLLAAPVEKVHDQAFNTGADQLNRRVGELASLVADAVPGARVEVQASPSADQRTYRASFDKFAATFPEFEFRLDPERGIRRLVADLQSIGLHPAQYADARFTRLRWLRQRLDAGELGDDLRPPTRAGQLVS
jgi:nucleoside-diphosphate-sugar epimerase